MKSARLLCLTTNRKLPLAASNTSNRCTLFPTVAKRATSGVAGWLENGIDHRY